FKQEDVQFDGWAIECRINAENPCKKFLPSPGNVGMYLPPGGLGVRVDSAVYPGYMISPFYDSMVARLITYGATREAAINGMDRALDEFVRAGADTSSAFHELIMRPEVCQEGDFNTNSSEDHPGIEQKESKKE